MTKLYAVPGGGSAIKAILPITLGALGLAYLSVGFNEDLSIYDEGIVVYGAARVLNGEVPYRDFWTFYSPGQFYTLAGLFAVFGVNLMVARVFSVVMSAGLSLAVYLVARRLLTPRYALFAWVAASVWIGSYRLLTSPLVPAMCFAFAGILCLLRSLPTARTSWLVLSGLWCGVSVCFRHDTGLYAVLSVGAVLVPIALRREQPSRKNLETRWRAMGGVVLPYVLGLLVVVVPVMAYFLCVVPLDELVYDIVTFPLTVYPKVRGLPYPTPLPDPRGLLKGTPFNIDYIRTAAYGFTFVFPLLVYGASIVRLVVVWRTSEEQRKVEQSMGVALLTLFGLLLLTYTKVRPDFAHLMPTATVASIVLAVLITEMRQLKRHGLASLCITLILASPSLCIPLLKRGRQIEQSMRSPASVPIDLDRARGIFVRAPASRYLELVQFIRHHVPEGEVIFVGSTRHDHIHINDMLLYFLSGRHSATKYHELHPGIATSLSIQERILREIQSKNVKLLVLRTESPADLGGRPQASGATRLDDFIRTTFRPDKTFGDYTVWKRKPTDLNHSPGFPLSPAYSRQATLCLGLTS